MSSLAGFDHWDLDAGGPHADGPFRAQPHLFSLVGWAKLRLAKALAEADPNPGLREVEELTRLYASTEEPSAVLVAAEMLGTIERARELARANGATVEPGPDPEVLKALRRVARAPRAWTALRGSPAHDADWSRLTVGRCAALQDGLSSALALRPFLRWGRREEYERLDRLLAAAPECRLYRVRERWTRPDGPSLPPSGDWLDWLAGMGAARLRAEALMSELELEWLEPYESAAP
jgi:hypothetical protein